MPQKTTVELSRIIGGQSGEVELGVNETQISFSFNDTLVISRLVDGQYPDYKQIIPGNFNTTIVVEKQPLVSALRAGGIFSQNTNSVHLEFKEDSQTLTLASESGELGKSVVDLPSSITGKSGQVIVNYHYVLDSLSSMDSSNVIIKIVDDSSPSLIVPEKNEDYMYLVMPIKS